MGFGPGGDRLVLITDGVNRMKLVAFWRDAIPTDFKATPNNVSRRIAAVLPITAELPPETAWVQSEQPVVVSGQGHMLSKTWSSAVTPTRSSMSSPWVR